MRQRTWPTYTTVCSTVILPTYTFAALTRSDYRSHELGFPSAALTTAWPHIVIGYFKADRGISLTTPIRAVEP